MVTHSAFSPELSADTLTRATVISNALRGLKACGTESRVTGILRSGRYPAENRAWHQTIQIALPLVGPAFALVALIAVSLVQG